MLVRNRIASRFTELSPKLQLAAQYVAKHPGEIAMRSLRAIAEKIDISPATLTRLARALDFVDYEELKECCRKDLQQQSRSLAMRAQNLQQHHHTDDMPLFYQHSNAILENINEMVKSINLESLRNAADKLSCAKKVYLMGALSSASFTRFWAYIAGLAFSNWYVVNEGEGGLSALRRDLGNEDFAIIISQTPHAHWSVIAAREISETKAGLLVLTDNVACPAIPYADQHFTVPDESPQFFSSYVSMLLLIETLMGMVIARSGEDTPQHIGAIVEDNFRLGRYWQD